MSSTSTGLSLAVEGRIATLTFERGPTGLLQQDTVRELARRIDEIAVDESIRALILRSSVPDFFACHYDVREILAFDKSRESDDELKPFHALCEQLRTMPKVTVAVVEGRAGGGGAEIALSCDIRLADRDRAVFCQPEVALGIIPGGSGTVRLARLVGRSRALEIVLGCDDVDATRAESWGLVNRSLPGEELWPYVRRLTERIASFPPHAVAAAKDAVVEGEAGVRDHLRLEARHFRAVLADPGATPRMQRFLDLDGQAPANEARLGDFLGELD